VTESKVWRIFLAVSEVIVVVGEEVVLLNLKGAVLSK